MSIGGSPPSVPTRREGAHVVVVCDPGSAAERHATVILRHAERALKKILRRLKLPQEVLLRPRKLVVRAADAIRDLECSGRVLTDGASSDLAQDVVYVAWGPRAAAGDLTQHLARVVLDRATATLPTEGERPATQPGGAEVQRFLVHGVARYLAHQIHGSDYRVPSLASQDSDREGRGDPRPIVAAEQRCYDEAARSEWRLPLYQCLMRGPTTDVDFGLYVAMQEAFGGYLLQRDGSKELLRFLTGARQDPNQSSEIVYGQSLELLEAEWLAGLRRGLGRKLVSLWEFYRQVWPFLRKYPWRQVEALCLMLISSITGVVVVFQTRDLLDVLNSAPAQNEPWEYGLPRALFIVAAGAAASLTTNLVDARLVYVIAMLGQNILRDLRMAYVDQVNGFSAAYFARMRTGDLMARFVSDMVRLADPIARIVGWSVTYLIRITVATISLLIMSWQLTLILFLLLPVYLLVVRTFGPMIQRASRGRQERLAQLNGHIGELIYAHPMIQIFNLQHHVRRRMRPEIREFRRVEIRSDFLLKFFDEITDISDILLVRFVMVCAVVLVLAFYDPSVSAVIGSITTGTVIGFLGLTARFIRPLEGLSGIYAGVTYAGAALRRVEDILHQQTEDMAVPKGGTAEPPAVREGISFECVDFAYGLEPILRDVSVEIPAGSSAAFVGPTGAGKTTLVNMIPRLYEPTHGSVTIDGRDVREFALPALRSKIALVSQETFLFNTTIRDNILMGKLDATDEEIVAAARAARIHDFVMSLPAGYDTIVGERGTRLSGGQRQRLAIARALLRDAPILILDEATSALDAETESEILDELAEATRGKTVISITHRLALAQRADVIHVLQRGQIVESGTHDELLAGEGLYRKLFEDQNELLLKAGANGAAANGADGRPATSPATVAAHPIT